MNPQELSRLLRLAQKTGDTLIVADPEGENSVVIMPVHRYEDLIGEMPFEEDFFEDFVEEPVPEVRDIVELVERESEPTSVPLPREQESEPKGRFEGEEERFYLEPLE